MHLVNVLSHPWADLLIAPEHLYLEEYWKTNTSPLTDEEYKSYQLQKIEIARQHLPRLVLCDIHNCQYVISVEMQAWTEANVMQFWDDSSLHKLAIVMSAELIVQLSVEQTISNAPRHYLVHYFEGKEAALDWLFG